MVRDPARRSSKYSQKNDSESTASRVEAQKEQMAAQQVEAQSHQKSLEDSVKSILANQGDVSSIRIPQYMACVREADKKDRELEGLGRTQEIEAVATKWQVRGLDPVVIDQLFISMFDIDPELEEEETT